MAHLGVILLDYQVPPLKEAAPSSTLEHVYTELKHAVMAGEFSPGQPMRLEALATAFKTSHMPVREALARLVVAGALEQAPRRSIRIPELSVERIRALLRVRLVNECQAVEWAAQACTDAHLKELAALNGALDEESKKEQFDLRRYLSVNQSFHFAIYRIPGNPIMERTIESLWLQSGPLLNVFKTSQDLRDGHVHHSEIIEALARGNGKLASEALAFDLREAYDKILDRVAAGFVSTTFTQVE